MIKVNKLLHLFTFLFVFFLIAISIIQGQSPSPTSASSTVSQGSPTQVINSELERIQMDKTESDERRDKIIQDRKEQEIEFWWNQGSRITTAWMGILFLCLYISSIWSSKGNRLKNYSNNHLEEPNSPENILETFYEQALSDLETNSKNARAMSFLGVGIIFLGAFLALLGLAPIGVASFVCGAVIEAISYLFYKQTNISRTRVQGIEDDLLKLRLAKSINNEKKRDEAIAKIIDSYLNKSTLKQLPPASTSFDDISNSRDRERIRIRRKFNFE